MVEKPLAIDLFSLWSSFPLLSFAWSTSLLQVNPTIGVSIIVLYLLLISKYKCILLPVACNEWAP